MAPAEELSPPFRRYNTINSKLNTKYSSTDFDSVEESTGVRGLVNGACGCELLGSASLGIEALSVFI